jgi:hypothetical protein
MIDKALPAPKSFANRKAGKFPPVLTLLAVLVFHIITSLYEYMTDMHSRPPSPTFMRVRVEYYFVKWVRGGGEFVKGGGGCR